MLSTRLPSRAIMPCETTRSSSFLCLRRDRTGEQPEKSAPSNRKESYGVKLQGRPDWKPIIESCYHQSSDNNRQQSCFNHRRSARHRPRSGPRLGSPGLVRRCLLSNQRPRSQRGRGSGKTPRKIRVGYSMRCLGPKRSDRDGP